jgi:hypothetical protein
MKEILSLAAAAFMVIFYIGLALGSIYLWLTGLVDAFHTALAMGIIAFVIPPVATLNGLLLFFNYHLAHQVALALHMI